MKTFSAFDRQKNLLKLGNSETELDILVIGGGITGAGVARDAAMRGMKVGLIEANDFAYGTSSRSSKLIHGGIRYLENLEFKLVFEALTERQKLFEMAPHLVHPLRFMLPLYEGGRVGMFKMGLGMWLYDALSLFQAPELHERLDVKETLQRIPYLRSEKLLGSFVYSDAYMDDDRLVHETLRSANQHGAIIANYTRATGAKYQDGRITSVDCEDLFSKRKITIHAKHVVTSVGPWTDEVGQKLQDKWKQILRPTKGVHLTFNKEKFSLPSAVVMAAESRIVFAIPRHEMVVVGTTDTDFQGSPDSVTTSPDDVNYLLNVIDTYFPGSKIKSDDIVASYVGVRPLVHDGSATEGKTSREHTIFTLDRSLTFVAGGKYTTYRLMAEQVMNEVLQYFPFAEKTKFHRCFTESPLNPFVTSDTKQLEPYLLDELAQTTQLSHIEREWLVERHGLEAKEILIRFGKERGYWEYESLHSLENTMCTSLVDFYARRVPLFLGFKSHGLEYLPKISQLFQEYLGWGDEQKKAEEQALRDYIRKELAWQTINAI